MGVLGEDGGKGGVFWGDGEWLGGGCLVDEFEVGGWNEGEGDGDDSFELDDDAAVVVDAFDDAFDAGKVALGDDDAAADFVGDGGVVEVEDAVVGDGSDAHEVLHLVVGHVDDLGTYGGVEGACHHVAEGTEVFVGHLEEGELFACGVDEEEVVDGWNEFEAAVAGTFDEFLGDGEEGFDALLVEGGFYFQLTVVGDAHGVPELLGAGWVHR